MDWNWVIIVGALSYAIGIVALFAVPANRKPGEATAWLMLILLAPFLGAILFLLLGSGMLLDRLLVESVNLRGRGGSARGGDLSRHGVEPRLRPPSDEDPCTFPGEYPRYRAANCTAAAVAHCILFPQQPAHSPVLMT